MANTNIGGDIRSRITLRPFRRTDAADIWNYSKNPETTRYTPWRQFNSEEEVAAYIETYCIPHPYCRSVCIEDRSIGLVIVTPGTRPDEARRRELGLVVSPEYWSRGVGTRVVEMVAEESFRIFPEMVRLQAGTDVGNIRARKVLEKNGFRKDGVMRKYLFHRGEDRDVVFYSLLDSDRRQPAPPEEMWRPLVSLLRLLRFSFLLNFLCSLCCLLGDSVKPLR
ncbi:unnamed protein product [Linum trigynum]|uniref:N-acetyltransferase domain-containing protein n=1 Tax=Linum trigynum TaxID=586398 RepID=A0AAV2FF42_9ROSI